MSPCGVITGCDRTLECLLPWWWEHYTAHNEAPVAFVDLGMSQTALAWCQQRGIAIITPRTQVLSSRAIPSAYATLWDSRYEQWIFQIRSAWFAKPFALLSSPFEIGLWIDIDCQVLGSLDPLFHSMTFGAEIGLVQEPAHIQALMREQNVLLPDETYYNSGVIVFRKEAPILQQWAQESIEHHLLHAGDQNALCRAIHTHKPSLIELPSLFNCQMIQDLSEEVLIRHYIGQMKLEILKTTYPTQMHRVSDFAYLYLFMDTLHMESPCLLQE